MPEYKRATRVAELLRHELSEIITQRSKDPLIGLVTITQVKLTDDLKSARVFVTILGEKQAKDKSLKGLERATKWIRTELGKRTDLKYVPNLVFMYDEAGERAQTIESLLDQINRESDETANGKPTTPDF